MRRSLWMGLFFRVTLLATVDAPYTFTSFDVPGAASTSANGINAAGEICGWYELTRVGLHHAFVRTRDGAITTFDFPGAVMTTALGINDAGQIVGYWSPDVTGNVEHMFLRDTGGAMTSFDVGNAPLNSASGINNSGQMVVNSLTEPGPIYPLFRDTDGTYHLITVTGFTGATLSGLNNNGALAGSAYATGGTQVAFIARGTTSTTFSFPQSTTGTVANGINDSNVTVGYYQIGYRGGESAHGFLRDSNGEYQVLDVPGSTATLAYGINNLNEVVGYWDDSQGGEHAFIATPDQHSRQRGAKPR